MNRYRRMVEAGLGDLYGAFLGTEQGANLGLFYDGPVGRFQKVGTLEAFRRRGICSRLVHDAVGLAFARAGVTTLVIVAEDESAGRINESVGFAARERQVGVSRG